MRGFISAANCVLEKIFQKPRRDRGEACAPSNNYEKNLPRLFDGESRVDVHLMRSTTKFCDEIAGVKWKRPLPPGDRRAACP